MGSALSKYIQSQPDETTCGPTCLHAIYNFYGDNIELQQVISEVEQLEDGGTLGCMLANHALGRGYNATIITYNINLFDPTWFGHEAFYIKNKLEQQLKVKPGTKREAATRAYAAFLDLGGRLQFKDLQASLLREYLLKGIPLLCGLSATFLYGSMREHGPNLDYDDLQGTPSGHFVVLYGYEESTRELLVADPVIDHPSGAGNVYKIGIDRVINAILLGIVTDDANIVALTPKP